MAERTLTLPDEILLLVLTDRTGALLERTRFRYALSGAILTELMLQERIELEPGTDQRLVTVTQRRATGDPTLDDALVQLVKATRRANPEVWVDRFSDHEAFPLRVCRQLCRKKVLDEHEGRVRLIFRRTVYADLEPGVRDEVMGRVRSAVFGDEPVDPRTALLTALAGAGDILVSLFDPEELIPRRERVRSLLAETEMSERTRDAALQAEAAVIRATRAAVVAAQESAA